MAAIQFTPRRNLPRILDRAVDHLAREGIVYMMELLNPALNEWARRDRVDRETAANHVLLALQGAPEHKAILRRLNPILAQWSKGFRGGRAAAVKRVSLALQGMFIMRKPLSLRITRIKLEPLRSLARATISAHHDYLNERAASEAVNLADSRR